MTGQRINKRILIICEGVTEYIYARSLQMELPRALQRSVSIEIDYQSQNDPKSLVQEARRREIRAIKERNPYDKVWLFFDNDKSPHLTEAFSLIERSDFSVAYTSLCIEHWFILHFENCGRAFQSGDEAVQYLLRLWPQYHKTKINAYAALKDRLETAMERARIINNNQVDEIRTSERNPYFTVQALIDFFNELKQTI